MLGVVITTLVILIVLLVGFLIMCFLKLSPQEQKKVKKFVVDDLEPLVEKIAHNKNAVDEVKTLIIDIKNKLEQDNDKK